MAPPTPLIPLRHHCSIIHDNVLYVYSPNGFQSIRLSEGSQWQLMPMGIAAAGATCVRVVPNGNSTSAALYVVGGSTNSSTSSYSGLQRYQFANQKWDTVWPTVPVTKNRRNHGSAYLSSSSSILLYAGSQDGNLKAASSQTFTISTDPPYGVTSFENSRVPPLVAPFLLPWNKSAAIVVGGSGENKGVFTFTTDSGWNDLGVTLDKSLPDRSSGGAVAMTCDDGSKVLEIFDMSVSPNSVSRITLADANGRGVTSWQPETCSISGSRRGVTSSIASPTGYRPPARPKKREHTAGAWLLYDGSRPLNSTRHGFALAYGDNDLVVMSGGNSQDPLHIFSNRKNEWVNASELFKGKSMASNTQTFGEPSATVSTSTAITWTSLLTPSGSLSSTQTPDRGGVKVLRVLGAIFGSIAGVFLCALLVWLLLHWRRSRKQRFEAGHLRQASGIPADEKDKMACVDREPSFMREVAVSTIVHTHHDSMSSLSLEAVVGRTGREDRGAMLFNVIQGNSVFSEGSESRSPLDVTASLANTGGEGVSPTPNAGTVEGTVGEAGGSAATGTWIGNASDGSGKQRSSGWSWHFSGNSTTDLVYMNSSGRSTYTASSCASYGTPSNYADSGPLSHE